METLRPDVKQEKNVMIAKQLITRSPGDKGTYFILALLSLQAGKIGKKGEEKTKRAGRWL